MAQRTAEGSNAKKIIVLTGATRGLGRALVDRFVQAGHTVLGCGRGKVQIKELSKLHKGPGNFAVVDVADEKQVKAWAKKLLAEYGPPDLLINNAALINAPAPLWEVPAETMDQMLAVNVAGVAHVIRWFVPAMVERRRGIIVNLSSGWGRSVSPGVAPYCTTKWAIEGMTQALAQDLPEGMAAVPLNPGIIDTDMLRSAWGDDAGQFRTPDVWAEAAAPFLLSLGAQHNGQPLVAPTSGRGIRIETGK